MPHVSFPFANFSLCPLSGEKKPRKPNNNNEKKPPWNYGYQDVWVLCVFLVDHQAWVLGTPHTDILLIICFEGDLSRSNFSVWIGCSSAKFQTYTLPPGRIPDSLHFLLYPISESWGIQEASVLQSLEVRCYTGIEETNK